MGWWNVLYSGTSRLYNPVRMMDGWMFTEQPLNYFLADVSKYYACHNRSAFMCTQKLCTRFDLLRVNIGKVKKK